MKVDIRTGRSNVFEVALLAATLISTASGLVSGAPSGSALKSASPGGWVIAFYLISFLGALVTLVGLWAPQSWRPHRMEQSGLTALAGIWIAYGGAVLTLAGPSPGGAVLVGFGIACLMRILQINREVRQSRGLNALIEPVEGNHE